MKKVIITGASGMIGNIVLQHCLQSVDIKEVVSLVRQSTGTKHRKLKEIVHHDFLNYQAIETEFANADAAYFCLGVYTGAVADAAFKEITVDYTQVFASTLKMQSPQAVFCFLSGQGADLSEKSSTAFARYKGMAENDLLRQNFHDVFIFRPAYIYPVKKRKEPNFAYRLLRLLYPLIKNLMGKNASITSAQLGKAIFKAAFYAPNKTILENRDILNYLKIL